MCKCVQMGNCAYYALSNDYNTIFRSFTIFRYNNFSQWIILKYFLHTIWIWNTQIVQHFLTASGSRAAMILIFLIKIRNTWLNFQGNVCFAIFLCNFGVWYQTDSAPTKLKLNFLVKVFTASSSSIEANFEFWVFVQISTFSTHSSLTCHYGQNVSSLWHVVIAKSDYQIIW